MDGITFEGKILSEVLKDKETIQEEIEAKKYIQEAFKKVNVNRHVKPK